MTIDPKSIRTAAGITQSGLAGQLGLAAGSGRVSVAQFEAREDWLLSRLVAYIRAAGGSAELVVTVGGDEIRFNLAKGIDTYTNRMGE